MKKDSMKFSTDAISVDDGFMQSVQLPKYKGYWKLSEAVHFHMTKRPNWFNRIMTKLLIGWDWVDE